MDTATDNEIETTMESTVPVQNGYTNGITNGIIHQDEQKTFSEIKSESKNSVVISSSKISPCVLTQGGMLRKDVFYPYQKATYMSPNYNLSSDSKRLVRRLQEPIFAASPGTVHLVYEVGGLCKNRNFAYNSCSSIRIFWYAFCILFSDFINAIIIYG